MRRGALTLLLACACARASSPPAFGQPGAQAAFDLDTDPARPGFFWDLPYPSDLRLTADGKPQLSSFPNPDGTPLIDTFIETAMERGGFPVMPVGYFRFSAPLSADASGLLVDLEEPQLIPTVSSQPLHDNYVPRNLLAVAPRPGFVLVARRTYAFVVLRSARDAAGALLGVPAALDQLLRGVTPDGALGTAARASYAGLGAALRAVGIDPAEVAAATVFTTGDVVAETAALSDSVKARFSLTIDGLAADPTPNPLACVLHGSVTYPQFQTGVLPFDTGGLFAPGMPKQRDETAPITLVIPNTPMPPAGYPLAIYFHGSGGLSHDVIDMGPTLTPGGDPQAGRGPGYILAMHGIASAGSALPVNPERLPGAGETAYLNLSNLPAMRDTFRQGVIEQRLFLEALRKFDADTPCGHLRFDPGKLVAQGQSMGGMYTNFISAVEPRIRASVPTGAGGFWTYFILITHLHPDLPQLIALLLNAAQPITFMHPALQLVETAWEPSDPFVSMPRLGRRPLPGHPTRPVYEPVGKDDEYFPTTLYDAAALAYGHHQAGDIVWPTMQDALGLAGLQGVEPYPVRGGNVVVQYQGDGIEDPHAIYRQLDAVKHQYGCFLETFLDTGSAVVPAPSPLGTPCAR